MHLRQGQGQKNPQRGLGKQERPERFTDLLDAGLAIEAGVQLESRRAPDNIGAGPLLVRGQDNGVQGQDGRFGESGEAGFQPGGDGVGLGRQGADGPDGAGIARLPELFQDGAGFRDGLGSQDRVVGQADGAEEVERLGGERGGRKEEEE